MSLATLSAVGASPIRTDLVPMFFDTDKIVTPPDNPSYTTAMLTDLLESIRQHAQLMPGWVCPSPDLDDDRRLCLEGNRRLQVCRLLGIPYWAFDLGRFVPEVERIVLTFNHNATRRVMSRDEIAERGARYIEITGCTAAEAAKVLSVSAATLSRAFGDKRIPAHLQERGALLGLSTRSLIAACPVALMEKAIAYAETPTADGKNPTRDQVSAFITHLKKGEKGKPPKPRTITLRPAGRGVTIELGDNDNVTSVVKDLTAIIAQLSKRTDMRPDGWPYLFV